MINSLLMLGSCYGKSRKINLLFTIIMLANLFIIQFGKVKITLFIVNFILMLMIALLTKKIKNDKIKTIVSILSIMLWSVSIDIICYFFFPFGNPSSLISYVLNGIIFNFKYVLFNLFIVAICESVEYLLKNNVFQNIKSNNSTSISVNN